MKAFLMALTAVSTLASVAMAAGDEVKCTTSSNGYNYSRASRSEFFSRKQVIEACSSVGYTEARECQVNVACDNAPEARMVSCKTSSNGYNYSQSSRDLMYSSERVIAKCQSVGYTEKAECAVNLACDAGVPANEPVTCKTSSNGYNYSNSSRSADYSRRRAISACKSVGYTEGRECEVNAVCSDDARTRLAVKCETSSNGYNYTHTSLSREYSFKRVMSMCQSVGYTDKEECAVNTRCDGDRRRSTSPVTLQPPRL